MCNGGEEAGERTENEASFRRKNLCRAIDAGIKRKRGSNVTNDNKLSPGQASSKYLFFLQRALFEAHLRAGAANAFLGMN